MNKQLYLFGLLWMINLVSFSQSSIKQLQQTARDYNNRGDHANAVIVLRQGLRDFPKALELEKDLVLSLTFQREYASAKELALALTQRADADVVCFQLAGNVFKALEEVKECEQLYQKGIKKFPASGPLYSEWGELRSSNKDGRAIVCWEDGIQADPSYGGNYYNAALYYSKNNEPIWALLYAEIYINMESRSDRARNMKKILFEQYQELLTKQAYRPGKKIGAFTQQVFQVLDSASGPSRQGLNRETLTMIRTRFVLDWFNKNGATYPFKLFEHQRQLLQSGLFEAYDQWLFSEGIDPEGFARWSQQNTATYTRLREFLFNRIFKIPAGQYYRDR
jgi:tetratricopeptide (TPR) repeat protein